MRFSRLYHRAKSRLLGDMKLTGTKTISKRALAKRLAPYKGADVRATVPKQRDKDANRR